ncbi:hypothetical protein COCON_G00135460 [Conger conger]|uniref:Uncharacterized protein n=1 Tax=Conger conger TaxID=82655 RepID=A0A9Q1HXV9_CONCO|nr:hypothetical protein COCON_G00135460 [Conger conger]
MHPFYGIGWITAQRASLWPNQRIGEDHCERGFIFSVNSRWSAPTSPRGGPATQTRRGASSQLPGSGLDPDRSSVSMTPVASAPSQPEVREVRRSLQCRVVMFPAHAAPPSSRKLIRPSAQVFTGNPAGVQLVSPTPR